jgi:hypothetical protein
MKQKNLDKPLAGTMTLKELNVFFGRDDITGHVKNRLLFIKTYDQSLRIEIFQKKIELLAHLNTYLQNQ